MGGTRLIGFMLSVIGGALVVAMLLEAVSALAVMYWRATL
jgi:hypothetical protein